MIRLTNWLPPFLRKQRYWYVAILVVIAFALGLAMLRTQRIVSEPRSHSQTDQVITIPAGTPATQIYNLLREHMILPDSQLLRIWFRFKASQNTLKAGDYLFESPISPVAVFQKVTSGDIFHQEITFPEGLTRFEVAKIIQSLHIDGAQEALELTGDQEIVNLIKDIDPDAMDLEGYLFPDTYHYTNSTSARQLIVLMVNRFHQVYSQAHRQRGDELGMSTRQIITLASMIELEARLASDRPLISSVYHNRLRIGMKLDCDPTVIYASKLTGNWAGTIRRSDLQRPSPYNTYLNPGLPPGPIACPGRASIEAALYPADTQHLYFVVDATREDGGHVFADRLKTHQSNVSLYRLSQRRRAAVEQNPASTQ